MQPFAASMDSWNNWMHNETAFSAMLVRSKKDQGKNDCKALFRRLNARIPLVLRNLRRSDPERVHNGRMKKVIEWYGWYGMAAILLAYAMVSFSIIEATGPAFQILNGTGALGIALVSFYKKAYQPGVLNIIWTFIAIIAIARYFFG